MIASSRDTGWGVLVGVLLPLLAAACAPAAAPLNGAPVAALLPPAGGTVTPQRIRFTWRYQDETFEAGGDGAVRAAPPDRARLDFFLSNGMAGGYAILLGDSLEVPGIDLVRRFLPPVPLLWATLGRRMVPPAADTVARMDGDTLRADIGVLRGTDATGATGRAWRLHYARGGLVRMERIEDGRVVEWIRREAAAESLWRLQYVHERSKRRLTIAVTDTTTVEGFDEGIWRRPSGW